jgi:hypothetical protein
MSAWDEVARAKALHKAFFLSKPNVVGVGVGYKTSAARATDELSVVVLVRRKVPLAALTPEAVVPREVSGIRTDVMEVGDLRALQSRTSRWRPAPGGVSLGHYKITAGTLGCIVRDAITGARLILSNNHVLANCNDAAPGDPILQPGAADGGQEGSDVIARLERFSPLQFNVEPGGCILANSYARLGNALARLARSSHLVQVIRARPMAANLVDAAVARPLDDLAALDEVLEIGAVTGAAPAVLGASVRKSGRTTASTTGEIGVLDTTVTVGYNYDRFATFENAILTTPMSRGGDSGSLLVAADAPKAVGLLFAGSDQATIYSPIKAVLSSLKVEIISPVAETLKVMRDITVERAKLVKQARGEWLMSRPNVVGLGVGLRHAGGKRTDEIALVVMVSKKVPRQSLSPEDILPAEIDGVPVDVKEVGELKSADQTPIASP